MDVQADLLDRLNTRVVVPLLPIDEAPMPAGSLNPVFEVKGEQVVMATQFLASIPRAILKEPAADLADRFVEIGNALDMVFQGF